MSLFCNSSPSKSGPVLSYLAPRRLFNFLYPTEPSTSVQRQVKNRIRAQAHGRVLPSSEGLELWFINSLVNAGYCRKHSPSLVQPPAFFTARRPNLQRPQKISTFIRRYQHGKATEAEPEFTAESKLEEGPAPQPNRTREELLDLVDQYSGESFTDQLPLLELPRLYQPSDGPFLTVSDKEEDEWPPPHYAWPADTETEVVLDRLEKAVIGPGRKGPEEIYQIYRALPDPRAPYLESKVRHKMLHHLSVVERKDEQSMLRYLSVIDDMKGAAIPLSISEWTSALSFVARYVSRSTEIECAAALQMWKEMEHFAGIKGNSATFNVLFDVACKAGKFTLAEMIYKEMESRHLEPDRYHHVSMIFYYGLQRSGDGARAAYKTLVEAGEVVDTVVLNAMISALIRSHETSAAENIYERMKRSHLEGPDSQLPPQDFLKRRKITRVLKRMAVIAKRKPETLKTFQSKSIIAPDLHTFRILVNHLAVDVGELDKTAQLLEEMKWFDLPLHGALFLAVFKGFSRHGGVRYTHWTAPRLEKVYQSLLYALEEHGSDVHLSQWLVLWVLRAFAKCSGRSRTLSAWDEIKEKWTPNPAELDFVMASLRIILEAPDQAVRRYDFVQGSL